MNLILDLLGAALDLAKRALQWLFDWFLDLNIFDRLLVVLTLGAFFAIVLPIARYRAFETWYYINNPLAVYMIGIVALIFASFYIPSLYAAIARGAVNLYYLGWVIYIYASNTISHAPYEVTAGYWINIVIPVTYCILTALSFIFYGQEG